MKITPTTPEVRTYVVLRAGRVQNAPREVGAEVSLTDAQAKYLVLSGQVEPKAAKDKTKGKGK
jgi:hypothetical protein